jgi:hypothetical protein
VDRRSFLATAAAAITGLAGLSGCVSTADSTRNRTPRPGGAAPSAGRRAKPHLVTLSFDDGFRKSFTRTAAIYEKFKLSACFNVLADGFPDPGYVDAYTRNAPWGDFVLWNELQRRGHEVMPHGWRHENLQKLPLATGQDLVRRCLDTFAERLKGFVARRAVFNFPYNASTPELEQWLPSQVRAFRTGGPPINALPHAGQVKLTCISFGPGNAEAALDHAITDHLADPAHAILDSLPKWVVFMGLAQPTA